MERLEVVQFTLELVKRIDQAAQPRHFFYFGLGALAIIPKIRRAHPRLKRG
jgi:hypothetical protein